MKLFSSKNKHNGATSVEAEPVSVPTEQSGYFDWLGEIQGAIAEKPDTYNGVQNRLNAVSSLYSGQEVTEAIEAIDGVLQRDDIPESQVIAMAHLMIDQVIEHQQQ